MQAGGPEVLEFGEIETPKPGPGEVLVNVEGAGVNFIDSYRRPGVYPMEYPHVVGVEGTGYIAEGQRHRELAGRQPRGVARGPGLVCGAGRREG